MFDVRRLVVFILESCLESHLDGKCHIYDSLYLLIHYAHLKHGVTQPCFCVNTCDTFLLRLSWLVSCSDEEGNIRRMIYVDDLWYLWMTAPFAFNFRWLLLPNSQLTSPPQARDLRLHWGIASYFHFYSFHYVVEQHYLMHCFMHIRSWQLHSLLIIGSLLIFNYY